MSTTIYLEGGGDSKELRVRCREGFRKLLESCGYETRLPKLVACGSRNSVFDDYRTALGLKRSKDYVAMWIDSEDPIADIEATWEHLKNRKEDDWTRPEGASDEDVLFMATCMKTWIVADRATLQQHYGAKLQTSALPSLVDLESRSRHAVQDALVHATRECSNAYKKGKRSFEILGKLSPAALAILPCFNRVRRILNDRL